MAEGLWRAQTGETDDARRGFPSIPTFPLSDLDPPTNIRLTATECNRRGRFSVSSDARPSAGNSQLSASGRGVLPIAMADTHSKGLYRSAKQVLSVSARVIHVTCHPRLHLPAFRLSCESQEPKDASHDSRRDAKRTAAHGSRHDRPWPDHPPNRPQPRPPHRRR